jgi:cytochrome c-type biogenesis protein CcmH/NrfG
VDSDVEVQNAVFGSDVRLGRARGLLSTQEVRGQMTGQTTSPISRWALDLLLRALLLPTIERSRFGAVAVKNAFRSIRHRGLFGTLKDIRRALFIGLPWDSVVSRVTQGHPPVDESYIVRELERRYAASKAKSALIGGLSGLAWAVAMAFHPTHLGNGMLWGSLVVCPIFGRFLGTWAVGTAASEIFHPFGRPRWESRLFGVPSLSLMVILIALSGVWDGITEASRVKHFENLYRGWNLCIPSVLTFIRYIVVPVFFEAFVGLAQRCAGSRAPILIWIWSFLIACFFPLTDLLWPSQPGNLLDVMFSYLVVVIAIPRWYASRTAEQSFPDEVRSERQPSRIARTIVLAGLCIPIMLRLVPFMVEIYHPATVAAKNEPVQQTITNPEAKIVQSTIERTQALEIGGRHKEAIRVLRQELADHPDDTSLHTTLAALYAKHGDLGSAIVELQRAVVRDPSNPITRNSLAWNLCLAGRFSEALPHAREARRLSPSNPNSMDTLAHAAFGAGEWSEAANQWEELQRREPKYFQESTHLNCVDDLAHLAEAKSFEQDKAFPAANPFGPP